MLFTYCTINGKVQKQFVTIGKKTYYFSKNKGVQRIGWRHIGKYYYYFRNVAGKGGYMLTNCTVDGIRINKKGHAVLKTADALRKTDLMQKYQRWADRFITPGMSDEQKIYACLNQLRRFRYRNESDSFQVGSGNWDVKSVHRNLLDGKTISCQLRNATGSHAVSAILQMLQA